VSGQVTVTVMAVELRSIAIAPAAPTLAKGSTRSFTATGTYSDGSTQDVTTQATWSSSAPAVATVSNAAGSQGLATAVGAGSATLTAAVGAVKGTTTVTVTTATLASIAVTLQSTSVAVGTTTQAKATGTYNDGSTQDLTTQVSWSSATTSVATVSSASGSQGLVTAISAGSSVITATLGATKGSATVAVTGAALSSIVIAPTAARLAPGATVSLVATGVFSDGTSQDVTTQATWTSGSPSVASVSTAAGSQGKVTALASGTATITAAFHGISGTATVTVSNATLVSLALQPTSVALAVGGKATVTAVGTYSDGTTADVTSQATWTSSATNIATVSDTAGTKGQVTAVAAGTATIAAAVGGAKATLVATVSAANLVSIAITPANPSIAPNGNASLKATGTWSDGTTQDLTSRVTWTSSNNSIARVTTTGPGAGTVTGTGTGTATISAFLNGITGTTTVTVRAPVLQSIAVTPANPTAVQLTAVLFTATGTYADGSTADITTQVAWSSSNPTVANIGQGGRAQTMQPGTTTITAVLQGVAGSTVLTVDTAVLLSIVIRPATSTIAAGTTEQLAVIGTFSDGTTQDITTQVQFTSQSPRIATVGSGRNAGLVTGLSPGTATI
jgi:uncharacterized protein YjdB